MEVKYFEITDLTFELILIVINYEFRVDLCLEHSSFQAVFASAIWNKMKLKLGHIFGNS